MKRLAIWVLALAGMAGVYPRVAWGQATALYVSQSGSGSQSGADASDTKPVSYITSAGNCGTGSSQIGAGTVIYLVGNFSYAAGTNAAIVPACSGASGNPVVITTYAGSRPVTISSPGFSYGVGSSPAGALSLHGLSHVKVDGGVPCGTTQGGVDSTASCGLVIENTAAGTAYDQIATGGVTTDSFGLLDAGGVADIEVTSVALLNAYVHLPPWQVSSVSFSGSTGTVTCSAACPVGNGKYIRIIGNSAVPSTTTLTTTANNSGGMTFTVSGGPTSGSGSGGWAIDVWGLPSNGGQSNDRAWCIVSSTPGILWHDSVCAHGGWLAQFNQVATSAPQIYRNQFYDFDHGISGGLCNAGGCGDGVTFPGPIIHDNHFHDSFNWDDYFDPANRNGNTIANFKGPNNNHHDPIHFLIDLSTTGTQRSYVNALIYNNQFDGDPGVDSNTVLFLRASTSGMAVFNNVMLCSPSRAFGTGVIAVGDSSFVKSFTTNPLVANNTLQCNGASAAAGAASTTGGNGNSSSFGTSGVEWFNNVFNGQHFDIDVNAASGVWKTAAGGIDYNAWGDVHADWGGLNFVNAQFTFSGNTIASWQGFLGSGSVNCGGCSPMGTGSPWPTTQGQDAHSFVATAAQLNLSATGAPLGGSVLLTNPGLNLTSLCTGNLAPLCQDKMGVGRPATGSWVIGAYAPVTAILPPLNLSLSAH